MNKNKNKNYFESIHNISSDKNTETNHGQMSEVNDSIRTIKQNVSNRTNKVKSNVNSNRKNKIKKIFSKSKKII